MVEDTPEEYVHQLAGSNFWGSHPLGRSILGSRENILGFGAETIRNFFHNFYHPERIIISVAGNVDHNAMVDLVGPAFSSIRTGLPLPERTLPDILSGVRLHDRSLEQVHVCLAAMGLSVTDPRRFAFSLLNTILGGNMSSRLFQQIREQQGLAYSIYSFITSHVDTGMFGVYTGVQAEKVHQTTRLVLQAMDALRQTPVSEEELHDAKEYTKGNLFLASESTDNQMVRLAQNEIHFGHYIPLQEVIDRVEEVTSEQIRDLACDLFQPRQISLTLLGPIDHKEQLDDRLIDEIMKVELKTGAA